MFLRDHFKNRKVKEVIFHKRSRWLSILIWVIIICVAIKLLM